MSKLLHYKQKKGLFSRAEAPGFHNQPMKYWHLYGSETPVIQDLAITLFSQVTSASACETNWSAFEYVYSKRRNKLSTDKARKLVYVHSKLKLLHQIETDPLWEADESKVKVTYCIDFLDDVTKKK